jgi:hypothetical protein
MRRDHPDKHRRQEGTSEQTGVGDCHANASLVDIVKITDTRVDECFKGGQRNALKDSAPQEACIIVVDVF